MNGIGISLEIVVRLFFRSFASLNILVSVYYNENKKGWWHIWEKRKIIYMWIVVTVSIENMNEIRRENFRKCDIKCAEIWSREKYEGKSRWTPSDVKQWRNENGYTWHERNDMVICDLVPTKINRFFGHLGGVSECKKCRLV